MRYALTLILAGFSFAGPAVASGRLTVVELFTSEGCSSCPPADSFLSELAQTRNDVLPLAFHVTYWNSLGWRDPFSLEDATARQYEYSSHFGRNSVFTPEMVVDGAKSVIGSDRDEVQITILEAQRAAKDAIPLTLRRTADGMTIEIGAGHGSAHVLVAGFDHVHRTAIGRGENAGRMLTESNIVRAIIDAGSWSGAAKTIVTSRPLGEDAAVLLQAPDGGILAAARL